VPIYREVNKSFFKKWTHESAYVLGFLFADGSIDVNSRGSKYISLQITDLKLLRSIRKELCSTHKISKRKGFGNQKNIYRLQIGSKEMFADLLRHGLSERKARTMNFPKVPKKYLTDFVRGYFDGDGNVWVGIGHKDQKETLVIQTSFTSASNSFLKGLREALLDQGINGSLTCRKSYSRLSYSILASIELYAFMYKNCESGLFLSRKRRVFEKFIKNKKVRR
jgi:intein-encoded DNA endonuclease-like protein